MYPNDILSTIFLKNGLQLCIAHSRWQGERSRDALPVDQDYSNPFTPVTTLQYALPQRAYVRLVMYDMLGGKIVRLANGRLRRRGGTHRHLHRPPSYTRVHQVHQDGAIEVVCSPAMI